MKSEPKAGRKVSRGHRLGSLVLALLGSTLLCNSSLAGDLNSVAGLLPANNIWNTPIDKLPIHVHSSSWINSIGADRGLHPDFGPNKVGIPIAQVGRNTPKVPVSFQYASESDPGPYPIPADAASKIEVGDDHHLLMVDKANHKLYELYALQKDGNGWHAGSGAIFDLNSNKMRAEGATSADAAGLAITPGLVTYDEIASGHIDHALRFTARQTAQRHLWPASHDAGKSSAVVPMGARFRLKHDFDVSSYPPEAQVVLNALKKYGMILADNGSDWFISGAPDDRFNNDILNSLKKVKGSSFEGVDESSLGHSGSYQAN